MNGSQVVTVSSCSFVYATFNAYIGLTRRAQPPAYRRIPTLLVFLAPKFE